MPRLAHLSLLCCLLLTFSGCEKSASVQVSQNSQASASPAANGATTTTTTTTTTTAAATPSPGEQPQPLAAASPSPATSDKPKIDACTLLTKAEIEAVQGDTLKETKTDARQEGGMNTSQCFYSVANFSKSISLAVTMPDPSSPSQTGPRDFWKRTFHRDDDSERERERERERKGKKEEQEREREREREREGARGREEEEEEESAPPKRITGVGEEAYWMGSRVGGALYVLKKNSFLRISVGGPGNEAEKIRKSKTLAQKALKRI